MDSSIPRNEWTSALKAFSDRNASRLTVLEIESPDVGAQEAELNYPLRGIAYDPRDDRIEIMLGDLNRATPHLTHSVGNVRSLDLLSRSGTDEVLRIAYDGGQVLLKLQPLGTEEKT